MTGDLPVFTGDRDQDPRDHKAGKSTDGAVHKHRTGHGAKYRHRHQWWAQPHTHPRDAP